MKKITLLVLVFLLVNSCEAPKKVLTSNGLWQQVGYGKIFEIKEDSVKIYDICRAGCNLSEEGLLKDEGKIISYTSDSLVLKKNIKTYRFERLNKLPALCLNAEKKSLDPIHNFEVLWNTFNEHYCYFEQRNIDWKENYTIYKSKITNETSQPELFGIMDDMLSSMNDGHVELSVPESLEDSLEHLESREETPAKKPQIVSRFELADMIMNRYCKEYQIHNAGIAKWGFMDDNIAYVQIIGMWLMAYYDIRENLGLNEFGAKYMSIADQRTFQRQDEIDGARRLMDSIFNDVQHAKAVVLDLRFNTGGKDEVGLEIMGHLIK